MKILEEYYTDVDILQTNVQDQIDEKLQTKIYMSIFNLSENISLFIEIENQLRKETKYVE